MILSDGFQTSCMLPCCSQFVPVEGVEKLVPLVGPVMEPECVEDRFVTGNPWDMQVNVPWLGGVTDKEALLLLFRKFHRVSLVLQCS